MWTLQGHSSIEIFLMSPEEFWPLPWSAIETYECIVCHSLPRVETLCHKDSNNEYNPSTRHLVGFM